MNILSKEKSEIAGAYKSHDKDCGSVFVQCALLSSQIANLTEHLKIHKHDHSSRRGLMIMVNKRRKILKYLSKKNYDLYKNLIEKLGIRDVMKRAS